MEDEKQGAGDLLISCARATRGLLGKRSILAPRGRAGENEMQALVGRAQLEINQAPYYEWRQASLE